MWIVGVTGGLGAGKSALTDVLSREGIPVRSADKDVHDLLALDKGVKKQVKSLWPDVVKEEEIDRGLLGAHVLSSPGALAQLEEILYPKLAERQKKFLKKYQKMKAPLVVMEVPLLMEVGLDKYCHCVILVSAPSSLRKKRVMKRSGMTEEKFKILTSEQMTERERQGRADFVIHTGRDKVSAVKQIRDIINLLLLRPIPPWNGRWPSTFKKDVYGKGNRIRHRNNRI